MNKKTNKKFAKGFTLIELLVGVLIIGILAAIALPQYRKAKVKAEATQLILSVKALAEAQQRFYLTNNRYADNFSDLDIDFSGYPGHDCPQNFSRSDCLSNDKSYLFISGNSVRNSCAFFRDEKYSKSGFIHNHQRIICYENGGAPTGLCTKIFNCTWDSNASHGSNNYYNCPEL